MVRTWDPGRVDAVSRPSASLPYTLFWVDALAAQLVLVLVLAKATAPRNARQPGSRRLRGRGRLAHWHCRALQQAQSDGPHRGEWLAALAALSLTTPRGHH